VGAAIADIFIGGVEIFDSGVNMKLPLDEK
jgi:hypothetical protein